MEVADVKKYRDEFADWMYTKVDKFEKDTGCTMDSIIVSHISDVAGAKHLNQIVIDISINK